MERLSCSVEPTVCSSKTPVGPGSWDLEFFRSLLLRKGCSHGDVQPTNLLTLRWLPSLLVPPFFTVPRAVTFGALLCCAKGSGLPSLWRAHPPLVAPALGFPSCLLCHVVAGELVDTCPAVSRWLSEGWHTSVPASGQHFPRDGLPAQNKLELWIYSTCKTSAGINNWESKGLSVERTSGTCSCLPPSHHLFLWKWSQLHW